MKGLLIGLMGGLILLACKQGKKEAKDVQPVVVRQSIPSSPQFDSILAGLGKCYTRHVGSGDYSDDLLKFYGRTRDEFHKDSIRYRKAVREFFHSDTSIIRYLARKFIGDTTACDWVYAINPYSSSAGSWQVGFNNEQGAVVLIFDYLTDSTTKAREASITSSVDHIGKIIKQIKLADIQKWLWENRGLSRRELRAEFPLNFNIPPPSYLP